jgi:hypothetical protein
MMIAPNLNPNLLDQLISAAQSGDWEKLDTLARELPSAPPHGDAAAISAYMFRLQSSLIAARTARADLVKSLHRLTAASRFGDIGRIE